MTESDAAVIARSLQTPESFGLLFERHFATIHTYLARRCGTDVADELSAEVFTTAFARRHDYATDRTDALPWLYGIATNHLRAHWRKTQTRQAHQERPAPGHQPSFEDDVIDVLDSRRDFAVIHRKIRALSDDDRTTLLLYAWEDLTYQEVAEALAIPVGTVRSRLNRVRRLVRDPDRSAAR